MFPVIDLRACGTDFDKGRLVGLQARSRVIHSVTTYARLFAACGLSWAQACERALGFVDVIAALSPRWLAQIRGLADGSGLPLAAVLALNCRTEILPAHFFNEPSEPTQVAAALRANAEAGWPDWGGAAPAALPAAASALIAEGECTTLCVAPPASADGDTWLAQNWDWLGRQREALLVLKDQGPEGHTVTTLTEAGMLAKIGVHEAGFALGLNILRSLDDGRSVGVPVHVLLRHLLDCASVAQARDQVQQAAQLGLGAGSNVTCADAGGALACFELAPAGWGEWPPQAGRLTHSNHYLCAHLQPLEAPRSPSLSTENRLAVARQHGGHRPLSGEDLQAFLRDRSDGLGSVCRHPDPSLPPEARVETVAGVVINVNRRQMWVACDLPDRVAFERV